MIPANELNVIIDNIGVPNTINLALSDSVTVGPADGEILVALNATHRPTAELPENAPRGAAARGSRISSSSPSRPTSSSQILNFGLPAPIDIQISGPIRRSRTRTIRVAAADRAGASGVPGAVDVHVQQILDAPRIMIDTDRHRSPSRAA